jgi:hypothetical protein
MILRKITHQITPVKKCIQMQQKSELEYIVSAAKHLRLTITHQITHQITPN